MAEDDTAAANYGAPMEIDTQDESETDRLVIATDFGTTFSCVAFASERGDIRILEELATENAPDTNEPVLRFDDDDDDSSDDFYYGDEQNPSSGDSMDIDPPRTTPKIMYWGYEVQDKLSDPDLNRSQYNCITRSKLLLDTSTETMKVREELKPILKKLKAKKYIKSNEDVIAQYLEQLFVHAKRYLTGIRRLKDTTIVEHVLCVSVIWSASACRKMQSAMEVAIQRSDLGSVNNLFLVSEPEAAAAYVLASSNSIYPGETFILLDAGGGTVDVTTYTVNDMYTLKLKRKEVAARDMKALFEIFHLLTLYRGALRLQLSQRSI
ncbi:hypothetical protein NHQ30_004354 [Ciborinia camelliae]|nr:hypothetical protein NHQ30_004354 [Ciborinia camelliae]